MIKKFTALFLALVMILIFTVGCGEEKREDMLFGVVTIIGPEGKLILDTEIYVKKADATAADAIIAACSDVRLAYTYENGMFDNFDGIASTKEDGWLIYSDYELIDVGAGQLPIEESFEIEVKYENYAESFNLN